jgi:hypothetical protein
MQNHVELCVRVKKDHQLELVEITSDVLKVRDQHRKLKIVPITQRLSERRRLKKLQQRSQ